MGQWSCGGCNEAKKYWTTNSITNNFFLNIKSFKITLTKQRGERHNTFVRSFVRPKKKNESLNKATGLKIEQGQWPQVRTRPAASSSITTSNKLGNFYSKKKSIQKIFHMILTGMQHYLVSMGNKKRQLLHTYQAHIWCVRGRGL